MRRVKFIKHEGCFIDHREINIGALPENVFQVITRVINKPDWCVEVKEQNQQIIIRDKDQARWQKNGSNGAVNQNANLTYLTQTVFFSPRGLPGFVYWYLLYPFHVM